MQMENRGGAAAAPNRWQGRWMLIMLVFFFSVPMIAVLLMFHYNWHPQTRSHGELISPPRALQLPSKLMTVQGVYAEPELFKNKWSMVYVARECRQSCEQRIHLMRQLHASLAKDIRRVQRVLIAAEGSLQAVHQQYPDMAILNHPETEVTALLAQFEQDSVSSNENRIYLVDPLGNLMMSFSDEVPAELIRKDLTRLLAYSWAG